MMKIHNTDLYSLINSRDSHLILNGEWRVRVKPPRDTRTPSIQKPHFKCKIKYSPEKKCRKKACGLEEAGILLKDSNSSSRRRKRKRRENTKRFIEDQIKREWVTEWPGNQNLQSINLAQLNFTLQSQCDLSRQIYSKVHKIKLTPLNPFVWFIMATFHLYLSSATKTRSNSPSKKWQN